VKEFVAKNKSNSFITLFSIVMLFLFICCSKGKNETVASFSDRAEIPVLKTTNVVTMISDSGITRYRISAPEWAIYDKAQEPYWNFPKGIKFERFDGDFQTDANIISDEAIYFENKKLWELTGNVKATNLKGEIFETDKLFWSQAEERIYSSEAVTITQSDKIIHGIGFNSNQTLSKYEISKVNGIFPLNDIE
jgi:LPS export ABC transporter protein LptC